MILAGAYAIFTAPILLVELDNLLEPFESMIFYSWYWWMYAINVIIYIIASKAFREIYNVFLNDIYKSTVLRAQAYLMQKAGTARSWSLNSQEGGLALGALGPRDGTHTNLAFSKSEI